MPSASTVIVMSDTHSPLPLPKTSVLHFASLSAIVNAHFACSHSYDFLYLHLTDHGCFHERFGWRHPSYCKLAAIAVALRKWSTVVFIDSDSWFVPTAPPLESLLGQEMATTGAHAQTHRLRTARAGALSTRAHTVSIGEPSASKWLDRPSLYLPWDYPYSNGPNCGLMIWRHMQTCSNL